MLFARIVSYFKGYLVITVSGKFKERFLNVCANKNILLWDIAMLTPLSLRCKISVGAFKKLPKITHSTGVRVAINARCGFPFFIRKYKKRKLLMLSSFVFILFMVFVNQFVWDIEVKGNETVKTQDILAVLEKNGLKIGTPKSKIDQNDLKNKAIIELDTISWLWVDKRGSKIVVDVRERIMPPGIFNPDDYTNIVSAKDGVIDSMIVRYGVPVVKVNDTVLKDMVLVTGKIPTASKPNIRYLRADADVFARTWYEETETFSKVSKIFNKTGKKKRLFYIKLFGKEMRILNGGKPPFESFEKSEQKYDLSPFGFYLGASLFSEIYEETSVSEEFYSTKSVVLQGEKYLKEKIDKLTMPDAKLLNSKCTHKVINDTTVEVTVSAEYLENIALKVKDEIKNE